MKFRIQREEMFVLLKRLCDALGPSGAEENVRDIVVDYLRDIADSVWIDSMGNVIALKKGSKSGKKIMLAAHMDEVGLFISAIDDKGFLRALPIGGLPERNLVFQRVIVKTRKGHIYRGVIGLKPPHLIKPEEARQIPEMKELFIDVGASSKDEVLSMGINVGDIAVFDRELVLLGDKRVTGKALDDRAGLAVLLKSFELIEGQELDVYAVATVQEEVGLKGARVAAFSISPDIALAIDVTAANDIPGVPEHEWIARLGKGPAIKIADGRAATGLIANPRLVEMLIKIAEEENIPYQLEVAPGGTTDASVIALNKEGVPAAVISIPTRYIHSSVEVLDLDDMINAVRLMTSFVRRITVSWVETLHRTVIK